MFIFEEYGAFKTGLTSFFFLQKKQKNKKKITLSEAM